jgi:hypothetical protein
MRSARSRGSRARRVDRVNGREPFESLEGGELVGGDRVRFGTGSSGSSRGGGDAARGPDDLVASRELRMECPLSRRKTCPELAPCRPRAGRLSWHRRAGPSATLDKALFGCTGMMPDDSQTRNPMKVPGRVSDASYANPRRGHASPRVSGVRPPYLPELAWRRGASPVMALARSTLAVRRPAPVDPAPLLGRFASFAVRPAVADPRRARPFFAVRRSMFAISVDHEPRDVRR